MAGIGGSEALLLAYIGQPDSLDLFYAGNVLNSLDFCVQLSRELILKSSV
jgi:hypothetical protein